METIHLTVKIETQLVSWNEVAGFCYSRDKTAYSRAKKREQLFIKSEIRQQIKNITDFYGSNSTRVIYDWHTSTKMDLGNLSAGEKFIADAFNELHLWGDDRFIIEITHRLHKDEHNYVLVTVIGRKKAGAPDIEYTERGWDNANTDKGVFL